MFLDIFRAQSTPAFNSCPPCGRTLPKRLDLNSGVQIWSQTSEHGPTRGTRSRSVLQQGSNFPAEQKLSTSGGQPCPGTIPGANARLTLGERRAAATPHAHYVPLWRRQTTDPFPAASHFYAGVCTGYEGESGGNPLLITLLGVKKHLAHLPATCSTSLPLGLSPASGLILHPSPSWGDLGS